MKGLSGFWLHVQLSGNEKEKSSAFPLSMLSPWPIFVIYDSNRKNLHCSKNKLAFLLLTIFIKCLK